MPKTGHKFTPEQRENVRRGHLSQVAWNKGTGGCKRGHDPTLYVTPPSGVAVCLGCKRENAAKYRGKNRPTIRMKGRLARYGLKPPELAVMMKVQSAACAICSNPFNGERYHIDHDHCTGKVRGLLCASCNTGIGLFKDSPDILTRAARYLTNGNGD